MDEQVTPSLVNPLDSLRQAGCKLVVNLYAPQGDAEEVFGVTGKQFERAVDLEIIRRAAAAPQLVPEYAALHYELERLRREQSIVGLCIQNACWSKVPRADEPPSLKKDLDFIRRQLEAANYPGG